MIAKRIRLPSTKSSMWPPERENPGPSLTLKTLGPQRTADEVDPLPPKVNLEASLSDLTAPAAATGATTAVRVSGVEGLPQHVVALVWRVAQEAVRNATRHANADSLTVSVRREPGTVVLEVLDDGTGFRPDERPADTSFGLRGLASLVDEHGGKLEVRSMPGQGTTVRLEVGDT